MCKKIVILGQTSTGKSDFAVEIAKQVNGEIISADSRQVYKGMDLGTGKITNKEMRGVPHHLLDVYSPKKVFTASDFKQKANEAILKITRKGKTPIICGGTGFYIDTLLNNSDLPEVPPNKKLRQELEKKTAQELFEILKKIDSTRAKNIDSKNKVRLVRSIEIAKALGKVPPISNVGRWTSDSFKIGLTLPPDVLKERIKTRLLSRIKKGMIKEVENLHKSGISWKRLKELGLEYRYVSMYLEGILTKDEMIEKLNSEIWKYAKRQKTWFKRDKSIIWIDPRKKTDQSKALKQVKKFLK
ncbi:MAG: tRNA (adenosine(37)-N6)-dimethylallyltransferase MiaA [Candidatus Pacebacteria bacterium]|nr:tRNA (adenosine(37)-N6)-dimethylallyltransferase MiaA [Candidatus Paceibacterota bacterium]